MQSTRKHAKPNLHGVNPAWAMEVRREQLAEGSSQ